MRSLVCRSYIHNWVATSVIQNGKLECGRPSALSRRDDVSRRSRTEGQRTSGTSRRPSRLDELLSLRRLQRAPVNLILQRHPGAERDAKHRAVGDAHRRPVSSASTASISRSREPPPVMVMPASMMSAAISGSVCSSASRTAWTIRATGSASARAISPWVSSISRGTPFSTCSPLTPTTSAASVRPARGQSRSPS